MFDLFRKFLNDFTQGETDPSRFGEDDYRLAAAALLIHAAAIDGDLSDAVRRKLHALLKRAYDLDDASTEELIARATAAEHEAVDFYHFTRVLNRTLDEAGRQRMVEMLWQIVYADGHVTELEDNLIWRAADLLGVSGRERIALRQRAASAGARLAPDET